MFVTNHVLSGALLGLAAPRRPVSVALVAVGSHFALDSVPHWGNHDAAAFRRVAVVDGLCGLTAMAVVMRTMPSGTRTGVLAGMVGAALPDLDKPAQMFFGRSPFPARVDRFHQVIQRESARGVAVEAAAAIGLIAALRWLASAHRAQAWAKGQVG